jgi:hypothetical protein
MPETKLTSLENEVDRSLQALFDLSSCGASELVLLECRDAEQEHMLTQQLLHKAVQRGYVTAHLSLGSVTFDALEEIVRALIETVKLPSRSKLAETPGLLSLLEYYGRQHGKSSVEKLRENMDALGAHGDLATHAFACLGAEEGSKKERREFNAWLLGTNLSRAGSHVHARSSLNPKTAKRALSDFSRLVRALEFQGCLLCFSGAHAITRRTPRQREKAYTVLRELVDNFDGARGMSSTRISISGQREFFSGDRSIESLSPLLGRLRVPSNEQPAPPHRSCVTLGAPKSAPRANNLLAPDEERRRACAAMIRISQGLPPTEAVSSMSVGYERIDALIERLLEHTAIQGSVFSVLTGEYGSGKTHLLLHLTERALERRHPVFRLNLERLNFDLGNPQRHLGRLLDQSVLPRRGRPSAMDRLHSWTGSPQQLQKLLKVLTSIAENGSEASKVAQKILHQAGRAKDQTLAVQALLAGRDLQDRLGTMSYRHDAYARFLLWLELLEQLEDCRGPVLLIDEAENLYTAGVSRSERRTALRSLSFYCGGTLPSACVLLAITPKVLEQLKTESVELLEDVSEQRTVLEWENAEMLSRRLARLTPQAVPEFTRRHRTELAERVKATHKKVRGSVTDEGWEEAVKRATRSDVSPRELVRTLMDRLERVFWESQLGLS